MYEVNPERIAQIIRQARKRLNYTQEELGSKINKSKSTINKYESGQLGIDLETLIDICNELSIDIRTLVEDTGDDSISLQKSFGKNPFGSNDLFLYYIGFNRKIVTSYIKLTDFKNRIKAYMKNPINKKDSTLCKLSFEYEGTLESDQKVAIFQLKNDEVINKSLENILIVVTLKFTKVNL